MGTLRGKPVIIDETDGHIYLIKKRTSTLARHHMADTRSLARSRVRQSIVESSKSISEEDWSSAFQICSIGDDVYVVASTAEVYRIDSRSGEFQVLDVNIIATNPLAWQPLQCWLAAGVW